VRNVPLKLEFLRFSKKKVRNAPKDYSTFVAYEPFVISESCGRYFSDVPYLVYSCPVITVTDLFEMSRHFLKLVLPWFL